jgi:2-keto-4-pentenoate hydratase/2-oxohepta-3-ene-1,7-dioic acid hydratase in catechol pathway
MKLIRYGETSQEKPGLVDANGNIRDLSAHIDDITGATVDDATLHRLGQIDPTTLPLVAGNPQIGPRIGPCIGNVGKFICIGLNYVDHAAEVGKALPADPMVFMKAKSAICGPYDDIELPRGSQKTDWEIELAVIIGKEAKYITPDQALGHVAGYCVANDLSERALQTERSGQWTKGKSADTFGPLGPWLVTRDEIDDPQNLGLRLLVNGQVMQDGSTQTMHFDLVTIISELSQVMRLEPGDVISTGTPPGVGMGRVPPVYLKPGDVVEAAITGLGQMRQRVTAPMAR